MVDTTEVIDIIFYQPTGPRYEILKQISGKIYAYTVYRGITLNADGDSPEDVVKYIQDLIRAIKNPIEVRSVDIE